MLHCRKEKKSDGSKYNVVLFSFVNHLQKSVVLFTYKKIEIICAKCKIFFQ